MELPSQEADIPAGGGLAAAQNQGLDARRFPAQLLQRRVVLRRRYEALRRRSRRRGRYRKLRKFRQHVVRGFNQLRAFAQQRVATAGQCGVDRTRDRKDLAPEIGRQSRGDQRATLGRRLNHQNPLGGGGDETISPREVALVRRRTECQFARDGATALDDRARQSVVSGRVDAVDSGADERDRAAALAERALVGRTVNALGEATQDGQTGLGQMLRKMSCVLKTDNAGLAAADDGHRGAREPRRIAQDIEQAGRIGKIQQACWIGRVVQGQQRALALAMQPFERSVHRGFARRIGRHQGARARGTDDRGEPVLILGED